jgi:alpha-N-arabinofuranosidase
MAAVPEFILRQMVVKNSLQADAAGFSFDLLNTFAPATVLALRLTLDGRPVAAADVSLQPAGGAPHRCDEIDATTPWAFSVGVCYTVRVRGAALGDGRLRVEVETREAGAIAFTVQLRGRERAAARRSTRLRWPHWLRRPLQAGVEVPGEAVIGTVNPYVYGHFIEHLERCIYDGIWTADGSCWRDDTLALVKALRPPVIRYPGGNFASGYHWEDGVGPREMRPTRFDRAWNAPESNRVGTDEFLALCREVGAAPFLVVNDGSGTPEEAARWVAYCNEPASGTEGRRRAANGHAAPYGVQLWGVGNEVWGQWQIGHTGPAEYAARLGRFAAAMRAVDPTIHIVAVGDGVRGDTADDPGRLWNEAVLRQAGAQADYLSFHLYQPDQSGWLETYDPEALHHTVCAAPLDAEAMIDRTARSAAGCVPGRSIALALDEWNLWLSPPAGAKSMHGVVYTQRDALYTAGMLNAFHRQCNVLAIANLAQLVNVLPAIVTDATRAHATAIYYPFWMYRHMQPIALRPVVEVATFDSTALGNIAAWRGVPYLDVTATRDKAGRSVTLGLVNRHPTRAMRLEMILRTSERLQPRHTWLLAAPDPLAANSFATPERVRVRQVANPPQRGDRLEVALPPAAVMVIVCKGAQDVAQ